MKFEEKIATAKAGRHKRFITLSISFISISLLCAAVIYFSSTQINSEANRLESLELQKEITPNRPYEPMPNDLASAQTIADEQRRQSYIAALNEYENNITPELNKIDLLKWDEPRTSHLNSLQEDALSKFSAADYQGALNSIGNAIQLAQTMLFESQEQFEVALSQARQAYATDNYDEAKFQVLKALMLNKESGEALALSATIEKLPGIVSLLEKINIAKIENKHEQELGLIKEILKLAPERETALQRKQVLIDLISNKNYKSYIAQSYTAIKQNDVKKAKQKIRAAKNIFPKRQEIADVTTALKQLEKEQRLESYLQTAEQAINADDWLLAKQQLEIALEEKRDDKAIQQSLFKAVSILDLKKEFDQHINNPYRLSKTGLVAKVESKLEEASRYLEESPSLKTKSEQLSWLLEKMNKKIPVQISSDNKTKILLRGVGVVGVTESRTIELAPGRYTFEGKRMGYKSKLINVLVPYDKPAFQLSIICDEPI